MIPILILIAFVAVIIIAIRRFFPKLGSTEDLDSKPKPPSQNKQNEDETKAPAKTPPKPRWKTSWNSTWAKIQENWQVLAGIVICHVLLLIFFYRRFEWYRDLFWCWLYWFDHLVILVALVFFRKRDDKGKPTKELHAFGSLMLVLLLIGNCFALAEWNWGPHETWWMFSPSASHSPSVQNERAPESPVISAKLSAANPDGEIRVREFWDKNPPKGPVIEIANVAWMESDFQQFNPTDRTEPFIHVNDDGSKDIGVYMINDVQWKKELASPKIPPEIRSYDLTTWEGNLAAAHYLENKYGAKNWSTYDDVRLRLSGEPYTRTAPVDGWSKRVYAHPDIVVNIYVDGDVVVRNDKGQFFKGGPKIFQNYGLSKWVQYQSATGQPVTLSIKPFK